MKHWKKMAASLIAISTMVAVVPTTYAMESEDSQPQTTDTATVQTTKAAEPTLLASWDFTGKNGTTNSAIADSTGKYNLTLKDGAKIEQYGDRSNNEALSLRGDGQYAQIDDQLFKDAGDSFTLEFASKTRHDDSGKFFSFIVGKDGSNDANTTDQANANKYLMFYNSKTAIKGVISNNNWGNEQGSKVTVSGNDNSWADYKIVVDGTNLAVFRNNALIIFKANTGIKMSDLGATTAYIGKSFYSVDEYWNGAMDDIKVYRGADLTMPTAVAISGTGVVNNKLTLIEKDSTKLTATVTPDDAVSKNVTWSSSDESVAKVAADGTVTGVKAGTATITATTELGGVKAELPVTVEPMNAQNAAAADLDAAIAALKVPAAENLPLVAKGTKNGSAITWKSSDEKLITSTNEKYENKTTGADDPYRGAGIINRQLQKLIEYGKNYTEYKPIHDELKKLQNGWTNKRDKYEEAHRAELALWDAANRYLHANLPKGTKTLPIAEWEQEYADLKTQRDSDYTKLKDTRTNVSELQKIRKCVDIALRADQPEQTQSRTKRHDIDR